MKDPVIIKSSAYGLTLILDQDISFEQLVHAICKKFATSRGFFGTATLVLSLEGRSVSAQEAAVIAEAIELNSDITISLIEDNHQLKNLQMKDKIEAKLLATTDYKSFEMNYNIDESIIGGMVIRIGDRVIDSSIRHKLDELSRELVKIDV